MPTVAKPRVATEPNVHRNLNLVTPMLMGKDVERLQQGINGLVKHYKFPWMTVIVDGEYGRRTARRAAFAMELIGIKQKYAAMARHNGHISQLNQRLIRNPEKRSKADKAREENRRKSGRWSKLRQQHTEGLSAAVDAMIKYKGVNESPANSNMGPFPITQCQAHFGLDHQPWCGCCVGFFIETVCNDGKHTGTWWPYSGSIRADALAGRNGLEDINYAQVRKGDILTGFNGGDNHVMFARGDAKNGVIPTVEGNTSSAFQDSDGGIIEIKERSASELSCAARLNLALV